MFKIDNLNFSIGNKNILKNISFTISKGEWISVIGPNGAGKTTLLNCLSQMNDYKGVITYKGQDLLKITSKEYFKQVAFLFQHFDNFSYVKVADFIKYSFYPFEGQLTQNDILEKYNDIINRFKLKKIASQHLNTLSGGELQKVKLAACLVKDPKFVFLDEIYNHLDPKVQDEIEFILDEHFKKNLTIFLITHDLNRALAKCTRVLSLKNGEVFFDGTPSKLLNKQYLNSLFDRKFKYIIDNQKQYII